MVSSAYTSNLFDTPNLYVRWEERTWTEPAPSVKKSRGERVVMKNLHLNQRIDALEMRQKSLESSLKIAKCVAFFGFAGLAAYYNREVLQEWAEAGWKQLPKLQESVQQLGAGVFEFFSTPSDTCPLSS